MALFSLPPSSPQADLNLNLFLDNKKGVEETTVLRRTLAPEWAKQSGVMLTWPHEQTDWKPMLAEITETYVRLAYEIATRETLLIVCPDCEAVKRLLAERLPQRAVQNIRFVQCPTNDTWTRDHAPLSVQNQDGIELLDFCFNGWGGKYAAEFDNAISRHLVDTLNGRYVDCLDFVLEGGSIETDGAGTLLTTTQCLLNPNRNPLLSQEQIEAVLRERLGVNHFLWLHHGALQGDDTDAHIDTLARLCPNGVITYVQCGDPADAHFAELGEMETELRTFRSPSGEPYQLVPLPLPNPIYDETGERLPATYANYLVMNTAVLMPSYAQPDNDEAAAAALQRIFAGRDIVPVDCRSLIRQHGSLHCATMQFPLGVLS